MTDRIAELRAMVAEGTMDEPDLASSFRKAKAISALEAQAPTLATDLSAALEREAKLLEIIGYALQDDLANRLTPRVVDIAYNAFMSAKRPNTEDGGPSDWFTDTRPMVMEKIAELRAALGVQP